MKQEQGEAGTDGLATMFADAHRLAMDGFERRLDRRLEHHATLLTERFEHRLADLRADLLKWSFLFWVGQLAAMGGMLALLLPRG